MSEPFQVKSEPFQVPLLWDHDNGWYMAVCPFCCRMVVFGEEQTRCRHWQRVHTADEEDENDRSFMEFAQSGGAE